jgi:hypothetical protein
MGGSSSAALSRFSSRSMWATAAVVCLASLRAATAKT